MTKATPLRNLLPGAAWDDASRRSMAICIGGFCLPNLFAEFGIIPQIHQSFHFLPGVCGAAGTFLASRALFMGYYHRKSTDAAAFALGAFILPYLVTWFWFRLTHPSDSAGLLQLCRPTAIVALIVYVALMWWHANQSNLSIGASSTQIGADEYGMPTSRSGQLVYKVCSVVGFTIVVLILLAVLRK
jgi:hypothetical protein